MNQVKTIDPTLARLSFWVDPGRENEFEAAYQKQVAPLLQLYDLVEYKKCERAPGGVVSRLFQVETPLQIVVLERALQRDLVWQGVLQNLGNFCGVSAIDEKLRYRFAVQTAPAGPGKTVEAGPGIRQGLWLNFSIQDGLPSAIVYGANLIVRI